MLYCSGYHYKSTWSVDHWNYIKRCVHHGYVYSHVPEGKRSKMVFFGLRDVSYTVSCFFFFSHDGARRLPKVIVICLWNFYCVMYLVRTWLSVVPSSTLCIFYRNQIKNLLLVNSGMRRLRQLFAFFNLPILQALSAPLKRVYRV